MIGAENGAADDSTEASSPSREMSSVKPSIDPFDDKQTDPLKANAMSNFLVSFCHNLNFDHSTISQKIQFI